MRIPENNGAHALPFLLRTCLGAGLVLLVLGIFLGAVSIPFTHESWTIKYKFGLHRHFLRTGQVLGVAAGMLMVFQFVLNSRLKLFDRIFAINRLYRCHRTFGMGIAVLAVLHGSLILLSEGRVVVAPTLKNWPQYVGLLLLLMICGTVFVSRWRKRAGLSYATWRFFHTKATHFLIAVLAIHVLFACDTFKYSPPRTWLFVVLGSYVLFLILVQTCRLFPRRFEVSRVTPAGEEAYVVKLRTSDGKRFAFAPGQFVFVRFKSARVSTEPHPFTISSPPSPDPELELTIRSCGDWTRRIRHLESGDGVRIDGPYGLFGSTDLEAASRFIMIAGGIGITPMLSILGALAEKDDQRPITLLWSNRTPAHRVHPERVATYENRLKNFRVVHILTRVSNKDRGGGRLDAQELKRLIPEVGRHSKVIVCGPPSMMTMVRNALLSLGFSRHNIVMERFDL